jgi:phosphoribosylanthranilate isomerase
MDSPLFTRIKICCIMSQEEAKLAISAGASAIGLVGPMPSGPGPIDDLLSAAIARTTPPPIATFLLTSRQSVAAIVKHHRIVQSTAIQIVDALPPGALTALRDELPGVKLVQVIHVQGRNSIEEAVAAAREADLLLLDSGRPHLPTKELGGTGRTHDWSISREIRATVDIPVFLAGGLRPENVRRAIEEVGPFGVDVCSGVRTGGRLDGQKLNTFCAEVRAAHA